MKKLEDFTIKEFEEYSEMLTMNPIDVFGIFELFGLNLSTMPFDIYEKRLREIQGMSLSSINEGVKKVYKINGTRYRVTLNHLKLTAGQFIDFQSYMQGKEFDLASVLSVFLIPQHKKHFKWVTPKYNSGYDVLKVQDEIRNHMLITDANNLRSFFLKLSTLSLKTSEAFLEKREFRMRLKRMKELKQVTQDTHGLE